MADTTFVSDQFVSGVDTEETELEMLREELGGAREHVWNRPFHRLIFLDHVERHKGGLKNVYAWKSHVMHSKWLQDDSEERKQRKEKIKILEARINELEAMENGNLKEVMDGQHNKGAGRDQHVKPMSAKESLADSSGLNAAVDTASDTVS